MADVLAYYALRTLHDMDYGVHLLRSLYNITAITLCKKY